MRRELANNALGGMLRRLGFSLSTEVTLIIEPHQDKQHCTVLLKRGFREEERYSSASSGMAPTPASKMIVERLPLRMQ